MKTEATIGSSRNDDFLEHAEFYGPVAYLGSTWKYGSQKRD